jgi:endo-1,4-beta-xylanase
MNYQILATEGYQSNVSSNITVSEGPGQHAPPPRRPATRSPARPRRRRRLWSCQVTQRVNAWNNGLTDNITIKNNGTAAINGWSLQVHPRRPGRPSPSAGTPRTRRPAVR